MAVDEDAKGDGGAVGVGAKEEDEVRPEMTHKEPSYKNTRWLRKRLGAPRRAQKICQLLEGLMEADETEAETDMGAVVHNLWKILLDFNKLGKDALKTKIKEHKNDRNTERRNNARKSVAEKRRGAGPPSGARDDVGRLTRTLHRPTTAAGSVI